jgi:hypothetical protein
MFSKVSKIRNLIFGLNVLPWERDKGVHEVAKRVRVGNPILQPKIER